MTTTSSSTSSIDKFFRAAVWENTESISQIYDALRSMQTQIFPLMQQLLRENGQLQQQLERVNSENTHLHARITCAEATLAELSRKVSELNIVSQ